MLTGTLSEEIEVKVSAAEAWKVYGSLQLANIAVESIPDIIQKIDVLEGDGGAGTVLKLAFQPDPGYPYDEILMNYHEILMNYHKAIDHTTCFYLRDFSVFNYTRGGLIELNYGDTQPFQYTVDSAFLASLYADYLKGADVDGWYCGDSYFPRETLNFFATSQIEYILGLNPMNLSYVVGYGSKFPRHVHHRGASISHNGIKYSCTSGYKWRDNQSPDPNIINGALVGGTDKFDKFYDDLGENTYTEPTMAGNAGLVAALTSLSSSGGSAVDMNSIFSSIPSLPAG